MIAASENSLAFNAQWSQHGDNKMPEITGSQNAWCNSLQIVNCIFRASVDAARSQDQHPEGSAEEALQWIETLMSEHYIDEAIEQVDALLACHDFKLEHLRVSFPKAHPFWHACTCLYQSEASVIRCVTCRLPWQRQ